MFRRDEKRVPGDMRKNPDSKAGFTLIEVMVAMAIFLFGAMAIARLSAHTAQGNADARRIGEATRLAQTVMEEFELLRNFNVGGVIGKPEECQGAENYLLDPEAVSLGAADQWCPTTAEVDIDGSCSECDDLDLVDIGNAGKSSEALAGDADHCRLKDGSGNCVKVDAVGEAGGDDAIYWVVWNLRAAYPARKMITVKLYVYWRGFDGRRHSVDFMLVTTAKDMKYYFGG